MPKGMVDGLKMTCVWSTTTPSLQVPNPVLDARMGA